MSVSDATLDSAEEPHDFSADFAPINCSHRTRQLKSITALLGNVI